MSRNAVCAIWDEAKELSWSAISDTYMGVGTSIEMPAEKLMIVNLTDTVLDYSWDGITLNGVLPTSFATVIDLDKKPQPRYSRLYVKRKWTLPTTGCVVMTIIGSKPLGS